MEHIENGAAEQQRLIITEQEAGQRADVGLAAMLELTRSNMQKLLEEGRAVRGSKVLKSNYKLRLGDEIDVTLPEPQPLDVQPENIPLDIIYEDKDIVVINKPAGMPVHPSRGNPENSLGNALAWYFKEQGVPFVFRCINRLDRDTSGLTIVAKHAVSAAILGQMVRAKAEQGLKAPGIHRTYLAIVEGMVMPVSGVIDAPIARQEDRCLRRVVDLKRGDRAVTHYRVLTGWQTGNAQKFRSLVKLQLETGRTHQIRVHMASIRHPLLGDTTYGPKNAMGLTGQCLHARVLSFIHPRTGEYVEFEAPLPEYFQKLLEKYS